MSAQISIQYRKFRLQVNAQVGDQYSRHITSIQKELSNEISNAASRHSFTNRRKLYTRKIRLGNGQRVTISHLQESLGVFAEVGKNLDQEIRNNCIIDFLTVEEEICHDLASASIRPFALVGPPEALSTQLPEL